MIMMGEKEKEKSTISDCIYILKAQAWMPERRKCKQEVYSSAENVNIVTNARWTFPVSDTSFI